MLLDRWIAGWAVSREGRWERDPLRRVEIEDRYRDVEYFGTADDDLPTLYAAVSGKPRAWLTLIGLDPVEPPAPVRYWSGHESVMSTRLAPLEAAVSDLWVEREETPGRVVLRLWDDDVLAASGQVGLHGTDAVLDKIETAETHRRRGLARQVVADLTRTALERGATDGLLIASEMGRPLYAGLGWREEASVQTLTGA